MGSLQAAYSKVSSKKQTIYGDKLHLLVTLGGVILDFELAGANADDCYGGLEILERQADLAVLGDKGYVSQPITHQLKKHCQVKLGSGLALLLSIVGGVWVFVTFDDPIKRLDDTTPFDARDRISLFQT